MCLSAQTPWPESLLHLCLTHPLPFPSLAQPSALPAYGGGMHHAVVYETAGCVTPAVLHYKEMFACCNVPGLAVNLCAAFGFQFKNLLSSTNNYFKWLVGYQLAQNSSWIYIPGKLFHHNIYRPHGWDIFRRFSGTFRLNPPADCLTVFSRQLFMNSNS